MATDPAAQGTPVGSPYGSPSGQQDPGQPSVSFQPAADAARAATQACISGSGGDKKKDWYRLIPRPSTFSPSDREGEGSQWREIGIGDYVSIYL